LDFDEVGPGGSAPFFKPGFVFELIEAPFEGGDFGEKWHPGAALVVLGEDAVEFLILGDAAAFVSGRDEVFS
jgi:hypothetical protein